MPSPAVCPQCRLPLDGGLLGGLCPRCVSSILFQEEERAERTHIGPYELEEEISSGGNGVVFRARHAEMDRVVALKLLRSGPLASGAELARFRAEVEALSRFGHPNLVPVYEVGRQDGRPWFTMPWYAAGALRISEPWKPQDAAALTAKMARAVHHAHAHGVLHRDIKPGNILIGEDGEPHVADFGLAKWLDAATAGDVTLAGSALGTPGYMAPEQAAGDPGRVGVAADVFGLGAVLYHLLTGRPPFVGDSTLEVIRHTIESDPPRPSSLLRDVDRDLETICLKALERNPAARYSSALALAEDLERHLRHEPVLARRSTALERLGKWRRRRPAVAALTALALLIFAAGVTGITWQWRRATGLAKEAREFADGESAARATAEQREMAALRARYAADMNLCQQALGTHNLARARRLLDAHRPQPGQPDLRGWEWRWLWQQCRSNAAGVAARAGGDLYSLSLSPDGRRALLINRDENERSELWDMEKGTRLSVVNGDARSGQVAFSPDGAHFASPAVKDVQLCNGTDGRVEHTFRMTASPRAVAFNHDGRWLAALGNDGAAQVWDIGTHEVVCTFTVDRVTAGFAGAVCFLPGEPPRLAAGFGGGAVSIVRVKDGSLERRITVTENTNCITSLAVSADGTRLVSAAAYDDFVIRVWDLATGESVASLPGHRSWVARVAFLKDGKRLVSCGADHTVRVWDTETWSLKHTLQGHLHEVWGLALTPDGSQMITGDKNGVILRWNPDDLAPRNPDFHFPREVALAVPSGDRILTWNHAPDASMSFYSPRDWHEERLTGLREGPTYVHPGGHLAHWEGDTRVRIAVDPSNLRHLTDTITVPPAVPKSADIMPPWFLCMSRAGTVILGDLAAATDQPQELPLPAGAGSMHDAFFLPSSREAAAWDASGCLWRWSVGGRKWSGPWKPPVITRRWTISQDGKLFGAVNGQEAFFCRTDPDVPPARYPLHSRGQNVALSGDGRWLAASDALGSVSLVDGQHPERAPVELRGHLNAVHHLLFAADSTRVVTLCSHEEAARFWALPAGEELITLAGTSQVTGAEFACGGDVLLVQALNGWHAWRAPPMAEIDAASPAGGW